MRIKGISSPNLQQYEDELVGSIILSIDNAKAINVETVSKLMRKIDDNQKVRIELISKNGEIFRIIL